LDEEEHFQFTGYTGAVFPLSTRDERETSIMIPVKNTQNQAVIKTGIINSPYAQVFASCLKFTRSSSLRGAQRRGNPATFRRVSNELK
jgi:hypothetical protein